MQIFHAWLRRAPAHATALVLPDGTTARFADLAAQAGTSGLQVLAGDATTLASGMIAAGLGGGTCLPLPPGIAPVDRHSLVTLARAAARPELALIITTSGSTGTAKGVRLPWRAVAAASRMSMRALDLRPGDAWLACLPLHHVGGAMILYRCLRAGATAVVHDGFDAAAVAHALAARRITHVSLVPPMLAALLDAAVPPAPTLRYALVGGAALHDSLLERARAAGWPVRTTWGMSETCATATVDGWPLPGVRVRLAAAGTLEVASPARMAGYLGQPDVDSATSEWLTTNDLGALDPDGRVRIIGRADDVLVSAGVNVHPLEVEARLAACPGVREAGVTGLADPVWGDVIACAYEGEAGEAALDDWCRAHLSSARRPRRFLRVARLPRTASGKLDRRALPGLWS
jgi:O-succinylbenzoic acid--CoA ligase